MSFKGNRQRIAGGIVHRNRKLPNTSRTIPRLLSQKYLGDPMTIAMTTTADNDIESNEIRKEMAVISAKTKFMMATPTHTSTSTVKTMTIEHVTFIPALIGDNDKHGINETGTICFREVILFTIRTQVCFELF